MVTDGHPALAHRQAVYDGDRSTSANCATSTNSRPAVDDLVWVSHWITPIERVASSLRHPLLHRRRPARAGVEARRQRDDRQRVGRAQRCTAPSGRRRTDDDAADDQEPRVRRRARRRRLGDGVSPATGPADRDPAENALGRRRTNVAACRCRPTTTTPIWVRHDWADRPRRAQPQPATTSAPSSRPC